MYSSNDCDGGGMSYGFAYNCTFTSNSSEWCCGGIAGSVAYNCDFDGNVAVYGGGGAGFVEVYGCRFFGNSARFGGGLYGGSAFNCVFVNNTASGEGGGGIHSGFSESGKIANCVFQNNDGGDFIYPLIAVHNTCSTQLTYGENGSITNVPLFVDAANGDFRLQSNSPCINWGDNSYVTNSTDLDGNPRIVEGTVDMGAYEYQGAIGLVDSDNDGINDDWERAHGGNQNPENTCSNSVNTIRQAYIAGLDPNNPTNRFQASVFRSGPGNVLRWNATSGRVYAVYYSTNLVSGFQPLETNIQWSAGCFTDTVENAAGQLFYKLEVRLEDSAENGGGSTNPFEPPPGGGDDDTPATAI
jgi:parallel beta-helix repeat protein